MSEEFRTYTDPHPPQTVAQWALLATIISAPLFVALAFGVAMEQAQKRNAGRGR